MHYCSSANHASQWWWHIKHKEQSHQQYLWLWSSLSCVHSAEFSATQHLDTQFSTATPSYHSLSALVFCLPSTLFFLTNVSRISFPHFKDIPTPADLSMLYTAGTGLWRQPKEKKGKTMINQKQKHCKQSSHWITSLKRYLHIIFYSLFLCNLLLCWQISMFL